MDKMLTAELIHLPVDNNEQVAVGRVLSTIFQSFDRSLVPQASSLQVPLSKIQYRDEATDRRHSNAPHDTQVTLYIVDEKHWNFPLPKSNTVDPNLSLTDSDSGLVGAERKTAEHIFASFLNTLRSALLHDQPKLSSNESLSTWHATFAKEVINDDIRKPDLILSQADTSNLDWPGGAVKACAELTTSLYEPGVRVGKELDTRAFLMTRKQPWRRFVFLLSFTNTYQELRVHIYDRAGDIVSPSFDIHQNPDTLLYILSCLYFGKPTCVGFDHTVAFFSSVLPSHPPIERSHAPKARRTFKGRNEGIYLSSQAISSDPGLASSSSCRNPDDVDPPPAGGAIDGPPQQVVDIDALPNTADPIGRGTICYLVRHRDEHWVLGDEGSAQNEMEMIARVKGVPELANFCVVQTGTPGDKTSAYRYSQLPSTQNSYRSHVRLLFKPRARALFMFNTKHELIQVLRDIVCLQEQAVLEQNVLHRDSCFFNIVIEDREVGGRGHGILIDWKFTVIPHSDDQCGIGGTVTIPFMSRKLLSQVFRSMPLFRSEPRRVTQTHRDDLESLFYVFLWICMRHKGPCGMERQLDSRFKCLPLQWTTDAIMAEVYFARHPVTTHIEDGFSPYFHDLGQLAREWQSFVADRLLSAADEPSLSPETISEDFRLLLAILDKALATLAAEQSGECVKAKILSEETAEVLNSDVDVHNDEKRPHVGPAQTMEPST